MTDDQKRYRMNIRNFLIVATLAELQVERGLALERGDGFKAACIDELIEASLREESES
jgi:hypothetical protein